MADVFLSYSRDDSARARQVANGLEAAGLDVFWDVEIPPGMTWADFLEEKLSASKAAVVLWSTSSVASTNVREEARIAQGHSKLIPVFLDKVTPPFGFGEIQACNLRDWKGDQNDPNWKLLLSAIERAMGAPPKAPKQKPEAETGRAAFAPPPETEEAKKKQRGMWIAGGIAVIGVVAAIGSMSDNGGLKPTTPGAPTVFNGPSPTGALQVSDAVQTVLTSVKAIQSEAQSRAKEATDAATRATQAAAQAQTGAYGYGTFQPDANTVVAGELAQMQQGQAAAVVIRNPMTTFSGLVTMQPGTGRYQRMVGATQSANGAGSHAVTTFNGDQGRLVGRTYGAGYTAEGVLEGAPATYNLTGLAVVNFADGSRYEGQFRAVGAQGQIVKQGYGALYNSTGAMVQAGRYENDAYQGPT
jgi:hypothetical protein